MTPRRGCFYESIYGSYLSAYYLPFFFTPRLFSLEYISHIFNSDEIHFVSNNNTHQFKVPWEVGRFNVKDRTSQHIFEEMLVSLNLLVIFAWKYDPKGVPC